MNTRPSFPFSGLATMVAGALFVSLGSALIKLAGARLPALEVVFARSFFMLFYCVALARRAGAHLPGHDKRFLLLRGLLGFGAYVCIFYAVIHLPLADALVIVFSFPLVVPLLAALFLGEKMEAMTLASALLGAVGMVIVTRPPLLFGITRELDTLALYAAIGAALFSACSVICIRKLTATEHPLVIVLYAAGLSSLGAPLLDGWNWLVPTWAELAILAGVGLFMSMGQHFITVAFSRNTAGRTSVLFYLEIVFAALLGYLLFDEIPDGMTYLGAGIIIAGAALLGLRRSR